MAKGKLVDRERDWRKRKITYKTMHKHLKINLRHKGKGKLRNISKQVQS